MRQAYIQTPCYTGDVSGACSALYELGGMTVMHDPSGCNSTYNTHDEIRWYDRESLIFLSGLTDLDVILGDDERLIGDVCRAAEALHPAFIALVNSPLPWLNGTDFDAVCRLIGERTSLPAFHVPTNGMHDYVRGAGLALETWARHFVKEPRAGREKGMIRANLMGLTPLDFALRDTVSSLRSLLSEAGFEPWSFWAMDDDPENLKRASEADVSLVVSAAGLRAARFLERTFGVPYLAAFPAMGIRDRVWSLLEETASSGKSRSLSHALDLGKEEEGALFLVGEPVTMGSLAAAVHARTGRPCRVLVPLEETETLLGPCFTRVSGEEEIRRALKGAGAVLADPMYRPLVPEGADLVPLPHLAYSGRIFLKEIPDLTAFVPEGL